MSKPLSPKQAQVLDFLTDVFRKRREMPKNTDIAAACNIGSLSNVYRIIAELEKKGYLKIERSRTRITLVDDDQKTDLSFLNRSEISVYDYLVQKQAADKFPRTVEQISTELKKSVGGVYRILEELEKHNLIRLNRGQKHGIQLTEAEPMKLYPVIVQNVPCPALEFGSVILGGARVLGLPLKEFIPSVYENEGNAFFGVELADDRQIQGFSENDLILLKINAIPRNEDIIVFEYSGTVTVRHYYHFPDTGQVLLSDKKHDTTQLDPNKTYEGIRLSENEIKIIGVACAAILRSLP